MLRTAATFAAGLGALVALAGAADAQMLRHDCFTRVAPVCNQIRDVDAAHRCVIHETNSCEAKLVEQDGGPRGEPPRHALTYLDTTYGGEDPGGREEPNGGSGTPADGGTPANDPGTPANDPGTPAGDPGSPAGADGQSGRR
ncbi:MAG: hypothetical protein ACFE0R_09415 [Salinarimonas sp.]